jgi:hypothetical protein
MKGEPTMQELISAAANAGWKVRVGNGNHTFVYPPDGGRPLTFSVNHSKQSTRINGDVKRCRKAGLAI